MVNYKIIQNGYALKVIYMEALGSNNIGYKLFFSDSCNSDCVYTPVTEVIEIEPRTETDWICLDVSTDGIHKIEIYDITKDEDDNKVFTKIDERIYPIYAVSEDLLISDINQVMCGCGCNSGSPCGDVCYEYEDLYQVFLDVVAYSFKNLNKFSDSIKVSIDCINCALNSIIKSNCATAFHYHILGNQAGNHPEELLKLLIAYYYYVFLYTEMTLTTNKEEVKRRFLASDLCLCMRKTGVDKECIEDKINNFVEKKKATSLVAGCNIIIEEHPDDENLSIISTDPFDKYLPGTGIEINPIENEGDSCNNKYTLDVDIQTLVKDSNNITTNYNEEDGFITLDVDIQTLVKAGDNITIDYNEEDGFITINSNIKAIPILYQDFVSLVESSTLIPNATYCITDYRTIYNLMTKFNVFEEMGDVGQENESALEPLLVEALSESMYNPSVKSLTDPEADIWWTHNIDKDSLFEEGREPMYANLCTPNSKGCIYRRIDKNFNDFPYDHKEIKHRRFNIRLINRSYHNISVSETDEVTILDYDDYTDIEIDKNVIPINGDIEENFELYNPDNYLSRPHYMIQNNILFIATSIKHHKKLKDFCDPLTGEYTTTNTESSNIIFKTDLKKQFMYAKKAFYLNNFLSNIITTDYIASFEESLIGEDYIVTKLVIDGYKDYNTLNVYSEVHNDSKNGYDTNSFFYNIATPPTNYHFWDMIQAENTKYEGPSNGGFLDGILFAKSSGTYQETTSHNNLINFCTMLEGNYNKIDNTLFIFSLERFGNEIPLVKSYNSIIINSVINTNEDIYNSEIKDSFISCNRIHDSTIKDSEIDSYNIDNSEIISSIWSKSNIIGSLDKVRLDNFSDQQFANENGERVSIKDSYIGFFKKEDFITEYIQGPFNKYCLLPFSGNLKRQDIESKDESNFYVKNYNNTYNYIYKEKSNMNNAEIYLSARVYTRENSSKILEVSRNIEKYTEGREPFYNVNSYFMFKFWGQSFFYNL